MSPRGSMTHWLDIGNDFKAELTAGFKVSKTAKKSVNGCLPFTMSDPDEELQQKNIKVLWVKAIGPIRDILYRDGLVKIVGKRNFFSNS